MSAALDAPTAYARRNRRAWNYLADVGSSASDPWPEAGAAEYRRWLDEFGWLPWPELRTVLLLCGAGGQQAPAFAALGLRVTVADLSEGQLAVDRRVGAERGLDLELVQGDAQDPSLLAGRRFDLVYQPASTCYLPDPRACYSNVARLLRPGGWYLSDHWNPAQIQLSPERRWDGEAYRVSHPSGTGQPLRVTDPSTAAGPECVYFAHRLSDLIGGICEAGFSIERLAERGPADAAATPDSTEHLGAYLAPFYSVLARRADVRPGATNGHRPARAAPPSVARHLKRPDLSRRWRDNGFVILRNALPPRLVRALRAESTAQRADAAESSWQSYALSDDGTYVSGGMQFHSAQPGPLLSWLHHHADLQALIRHLAEDDRIGANDNVAYMYYDEDSSIDVHTDVPECEATMLTSVYGQTPPLVAYPRLRDIGPQDLLRIARRTHGRPPGGVHLEVPVGGLLIINGRRLPHRRPALARGQPPCGIAALCFARAAGES